MTCRELIEFLDDYHAGSLAPDRKCVFESHLAECPPCVAFLETYRKAVELCKDAASAVPGDVPAELVKAILAARKG